VVTAHQAELKYLTADALRYYFWALMLLKSLPDSESVTMMFAEKSQKLDILIPLKINELLNNLQFEVSGRQTTENLTEYFLQITYGAHEVVNCDYSFFDGRNWALPVSAKDGRGIAELTGDTAQHRTLRLKIEYAFENEWKIDSEVADVLGKVEPVIFKNCYKNIDLIPKPATHKERNSAPASDFTKQDKSTSTANRQVGDNYDGAKLLPVLKRVETAIKTQNYESVRDCFTAEGYEIFTQLVKFGKGTIVGTSNYTFVKFEDGILARSLPMRFSFAGNRRVFVEDVVFNFAEKEGKIRSLSFALPNNVAKSILNFEHWDEYSRLALVNFIENYKTAYALKRLDYIASIFSDNALIIVGKVVKEYLGEKERFNVQFKPNIKRTQYSKSQYMKQLSTVFKSNEYVNLKFTDISVKKAGVGGEIYGIQLKQDYFSSSYGDTGYLFLMVDLNKTDEPVIHVRTWQSEKDPDFGVYDISNF
jgi:hypothetical protein